MSPPGSWPRRQTTTAITRLRAAAEGRGSRSYRHLEVRATESGRHVGEGRGWRCWLAALFLAALALRLQNLDSSPWGDEAYYYFITHDLAAFWNTNAYPVSGSTFPVFPLAYHVFAGNLLSLRAANAIVGASAVPLGMVTMRELGARRAVALAGGAFLAVNTILVQFSGLAFLDMLGAVIGLGAVLAYLRGYFGLAAALVAGAVLEKEYYAILGIALAMDQLITRRRIYFELALGAIPVIGWLLLRYVQLHSNFHYLMFVHAYDVLTVGMVDQAVGSFALLPLAAVSAVLSPRLRAAALYVAILLVILLFWGNAEPWYWCLSVILVTLLAVHGVTLALAESRRRGLVIGIAAALALAASLAQAEATFRYLATWHDRDLDRVAAYLDGQPAQPVDVVGCVWSYSHYPLGGPSRPAKTLYGWKWNEASSRLAVACPGAQPAPLDWRPLYRSGGYTVLGR